MTESDKTHTIPLFELGDTFLPGELFPLNVFEPRYLELVKHCQEEASEDLSGLFGVIPGPRKIPGEIGTIVRIVDVVEPQEGETLVTMNMAEGRFRVLEAVDSLPFPAAKVTLLPTEVLDETEENYVELLRLAEAQLQENVSFVGARRQGVVLNSFELASLLELDNSEREAVLVTPTAERRANLVKDFLVFRQAVDEASASMNFGDTPSNFLH